MLSRNGAMPSIRRLRRKSRLRRLNTVRWTTSYLIVKESSGWSRKMKKRSSEVCPSFWSTNGSILGSEKYRIDHLLVKLHFSNFTFT